MSLDYWLTQRVSCLTCMFQNYLIVMSYSNHSTRNCNISVFQGESQTPSSSPFVWQMEVEGANKKYRRFSPIPQGTVQSKGCIKRNEWGVCILVECRVLSLKSRVSSWKGRVWKRQVWKSSLKLDGNVALRVFRCLQSCVYNQYMIKPILNFKRNFYYPVGLWSCDPESARPAVGRRRWSYRELCSQAV